MDKKEISVKDLLLITLDSLVEKAWANLGLISHPETGEIHEDSGQAKLAIDALENIFRLLQDSMESVERVQIATVLTNLQLNYAKKFGKQG